MTIKSGSANNEVITLAEAVTLAGLFNRRVERTPGKVAYRQYDRPVGIWRSYTWQQVADLSGRWRHGFRQQGLAVGERIAIWLENSVDWVCCEQAALAEGLVVVPLYAWDNPENQAYILNNCGCSILVIDTVAQWQDLLQCGHPLSALERVLCREESSTAEQHLILTPLSHWLPETGGEDAGPELHPEDLATIVYTSGTTGHPKGVMLSHRNILWNCEAVLKVHPALADDIFLSFLPLSHAFERTVGYYIPMMSGCCIAYCRSIQDLAEDMRLIRPTVLISVPRIYERIAGRIQERLAEKGRLAQWLFAAAVAVGFRRFEARRAQRRQRLLDLLTWPIFERLVASPLLDRFGGRLRLAVTGGAPVQERISRLFLGLGLPLVQGYGLTEAAPVVSANLQEENRPASVGPPLPGVEVRLSTEKELLVRSPGVMLGYWQRPELSREAVDDQGWLKTGDIAELIDGFIHIVGRSKELLVTSTGEKVSPVALEMALEQDPLISQAMVVGEGKPMVAALLVVHAQGWRRLAEGIGLDPDDPTSLESSQVHTAVLRIVNTLLHDFPVSAQVRGVALLHEEWTIDNGLLTPTLKLIRERITARFARQIDAIYSRSRANSPVG